MDVTMDTNLEHLQILRHQVDEGKEQFFILNKVCIFQST